jgi:hypothetical protein
VERLSGGVVLPAVTDAELLLMDKSSGRGCCGWSSIGCARSKTLVLLVADELGNRNGGGGRGEAAPWPSQSDKLQ